MKILIVDDEQYSVKAMKEGIRWDRAVGPDTEVFCAYHALGARELLQKQDIDILICDIEMPRESGLELIRWLRERDKLMGVVIITCHAEFRYAREAISLKVYDYCVKPIEFQRMEAILSELAQKLRTERDIRKKSVLGGFWEDNRENLESAFWRNLLQGKFGGDSEEMRKRAVQAGVALADGEEYHLVVIWLRHIVLRMVKWDEDKIYQAIGNLAREIFNGTMESKRVVLTGNIIGVISEGENIPWLRQKAEELIRECEEQLHIRVSCYVELSAVRAEALGGTLEKIRRVIAVNPGKEGGIWIAGEEQKTKQGADLSVPKVFSENVALGNYGEAYRLTHLWLRKQDAEKLPQMAPMRENMIQEIYYHLKQKGLSAQDLQNEELQQAWFVAGNSMEEMDEWIRLLLKCTERVIGNAKDQGNSAVAEMKKFMREHLSDKLSRESISEWVHLNPDYASRLFKNEEKESIMDYLLKQRIIRAVQLMNTTELSLGEIAERTGFVTASHFSVSFKKIMGYAPSKHRKKDREEKE